tara:strand:- start:4013 stop:4393 length:381 start_codon:yes stop_codon:yes gene_type:complete
METVTKHSTTSSTLPLLQSWGELSVAESHAIEAGDWNEVDRLQNEKSQLRQQLESTDNNNDTDQDREWGIYLLSLEAHNRSLIEKCLDSIQQQMENDSRSIKNLQNVQRAYSHAPLRNNGSLQEYL